MIILFFRGYEGLELESAPGLEGLRALLKFKSLRRLTISRASDSQLAVNLERSGLLEQLEHLELDPSGVDESLFALIGTSALQRVSVASFGSFLTVTAPIGELVVKGESDFAQMAEAVLASVGHAERVSLAVTEYPASAARLDALEAWLRKNVEHHTFSRLKKTAAAAFHERVRLMVSTQ